MTPFSAPTKFETPAFTLRCYYPDDAPLLQVATNASFEHLRTFMPWATDSQTLDQAHALTSRFRATWLLSTDFVIACVSPDGSELLGGCGYHLREGLLEHKRAELGMWISGSQAGKGLGTALLAALLEWGFTDWGWRRLTWRCDARNGASIRIAQKNEMRLESTEVEYDLANDGTLADRHSYALLSREWRDARA